MLTLWQLFLGLAIFLYGMQQMEIGIRQLGHRRLKHWIMQYTNNRLGSVGVGIGVTAVLQSSSLVSLLVLAFASAGAIPLFNAIGVLLGANLGTTFTGWVVATLGFKLKLDALTIPLVGFGGIIQVIFPERTRLRGIGFFLLGLGLLLFGLDIMKSTVEDLPEKLDISALQGRAAWVYLLAGVGISAVVQSSSATMMIAITALHSGVLGLSAAAALVIGADLGTTSTTILGSLRGHAIKRQLALSHVVFNVSVDISAFALLLPELPRILGALHLSDPLYGLVAFHSLFNLFGLLIFLPFLSNYANWIGGFFQQSRLRPQLSDVPANVPEAALAAQALALQALTIDAIALNLHNFRASPEQLHLSGELARRLASSYREALPFEQRYEQIKQQENAITEFALDMQQHELNADQARELSRLLSTSRLVVYACKGLKDSREHLATLRHDQSQLGMQLYKSHLENQLHLYRNWLPLLFGAHDPVYIEEQHVLLKQRNNEYQHRCTDEIYRAELLHESSDLDRSTLLNVIREIHHAGKNLLSALAEWNKLQH